VLLGLPGVPLGSALHVEAQHAWLLNVDVADGGLLEKSVDLELLLIGDLGDQIFALLDSFSVLFDSYWIRPCLPADL